MMIKSKSMIFLAVFLALSLICISSISAVVMSEINQGKLEPGKEASLSITLENNLDDYVEDVSFSLSFTDPVTQKALPFSAVGSSEESISEIKDGRSKTIDFDIKASSSIVPGDYNIPYTLTYTDTSNSQKMTKTGTIGINVYGNVELDFSLNLENPIIDQKGKIILTIVNKGFADAKFVSVKINPSGYTLFSKEEIYIGTIASDDFETIESDVLFGKNPIFSGQIEYKDFDNKVVNENFNLDVSVYTKEKALELGIIKKNNALVFVAVIVILIIIWIVVRSLRKKARLKRIREKSEQRS